MKDALIGLLILVVSILIAVTVVNAQETNRIEQHHQSFCQIVDGRLISSGMVDCNDGK